MDIPILVHPACRNIPAVEAAISTINGLQMQFHLALKRFTWVPNSGSQEIGHKTLTLRIRKNHPARPVILVVDTPLKNGLFDYQAGGIAVVSTTDWDDHYSPPPLKIWLTYVFACALAPFAAELPDEQIDKMSHSKMRGCISDSTSGKRELRIGLVSAHLCAECEAKLTEWGVSDKLINAIVEILAYVRAFCIRRPRTTPTHVFIGHGRHDDWREVQTFLRSLDIKVDEFNSDPTAGVPTVERLQEMIDRACFAFLVMTPEDAHKDGQQHARENVIHEIGLFQAKLGFRKAIIIKHEGVASFSNVAGLTYLSYQNGGVTAKFGDIVHILAREGILDPRTELVRKALGWKPITL